MPAAIHHDEDFINKSLLASLDAQADAEPNNYRSSFRPRQFYQQDPFYPQYDYQDQYKHFPVQLSSQTPYGPHVPAGIPPPPAPPVPSASNAPTSTTTTAGGEEISTIFVVGFPEDMSVRPHPCFLFIYINLFFLRNANSKTCSRLAPDSRPPLSRSPTRSTRRTMASFHPHPIPTLSSNEPTPPIHTT